MRDKTDWDKLSLKTDEEILEGIANDPDAAPLSPEQLSRMRRVYPDCKKLIKDLLGATEGSAVLDVQIHVDIGQDVIVPIPTYTTNLQDALLLVPEGWAWDVDYDKDASANPPWSKWVSSAFCHDASRDPQNPECPKGMCHRAATPALAVCIAALKARNNE